MALPSTPKTGSDELFDTIAELSGLSPLLSRGLLRRALVDVGGDPSRAAPAEYVKALPGIASRMRAYLPADEMQQRLERIRMFLADAR